MNLRDFSEWKSAVHKLNSDAKSIISLRDEAYSQLADELKIFFNEHDLPVKEMNFNADGSIITVHLDGNTKNCISFNRKFLIEIGMPFSVQRTLNCDDGKVEHELFLELYPLEEDF